MVVQTEGQFKSKFPQSTKGNLLYHIQAFLVSAGLILTVVTLIVSLVKGSALATIAGMLATLVGYAAIFYYSCRGYHQTDGQVFMVAVYGVTAMLFFRALMPEQNMLTRGFVVLAFGALLVFAERIDRSEQARVFLLAAIGMLVVSAFATAFMVMSEDMGTLQAVLLKLLPWSQVVLAGTLALAFRNK